MIDDDDDVQPLRFLPSFLPSSLSLSLSPPPPIVTKPSALLYSTLLYSTLLQSRFEMKKDEKRKEQGNFVRERSCSCSCSWYIHSIQSNPIDSNPMLCHAMPCFTMQRYHKNLPCPHFPFLFTWLAGRSPNLALPLVPDRMDNA